MTVEDTRCGVVAIVGAPNAGKSTLLNQAVGAKVSIVTHKVQTTRTRIRGIAVAGESQIVFVDTPGIFMPRDRLQRAMVDAAWRAVGDADVVIHLHDAARGALSEEATELARRLAQRSSHLVLALNKVDKIKRDALLALTQSFQSAADYKAVFMISALTGDGVDDLIAYLAAEVPPGPWLYPEDQLSDLPQRLIAAEVTREKLFLKLHQELPYALTVETESWEAFQDGSVKISQTIYVTREGHKRMAIGKGGQTIRAVREEAQAELAEMLGTKVHLFLFVKVRERWHDDPERYREWGLNFTA